MPQELPAGGVPLLTPATKSKSFRRFRPSDALPFDRRCPLPRPRSARIPHIAAVGLQMNN